MHWSRQEWAAQMMLKPRFYAISQYVLVWQQLKRSTRRAHPEQTDDAHTGGRLGLAETAIRLGIGIKCGQGLLPHDSTLLPVLPNGGYPFAVRVLDVWDNPFHMVG
jgi:hypothetical protein